MRFNLKNLRLRHLSQRLVLGFVTLGLVICTACLLIAYLKYKTAVEAQYNESAYRIAAVGLSYIDGDAIWRYLDSGQTDAAYDVMGQALSSLRSNMQANYIYIARYSNLQLTYVFDADNPADDYEPYQLGDTGPINAEYQADLDYIIQTGQRSQRYFYSQSQFGYNTSAIVPIYTSDGQVAALLGVEVAMETMQHLLTQFILFTFLVSAALTALFVSLYLIYLQKHVVAPIRLMTHEAGQFIQDEAAGSLTLDQIRTGDEIETLARAIQKMEADIHHYIRHLTQVTAEKERISTELGVAAHIQSSMLPCIFPAFPDDPDFDIFATMAPAREVGGDFYDFFMPDPQHLVFLIADVSGKGVPAALYMVIARTLIKNEALAGSSAADIFTRVNAQLCDNNEANMFVTAWLGIYDRGSGRLSFVNAGHNPPYIGRAGQPWQRLQQRPGFVLGGLQGTRFHAGELILQAGDTVYLYTDGVTEATDVQQTLFGEARLAASLNRHSQQAPASLLQALSQDVASFTCGGEPADDMTMLALRINSDARPSLRLLAELEQAPRLLAFLDGLLQGTRCSVTTQHQLHIVLDELFSNVVRYSGSSWISLYGQTDRQGVELTLADHGMPYDPLSSAQPDVSLSAIERPAGGLGLLIVRRLTDQLSYSYVNGQNRLTLRKNFQEV
ncbi:MAG: SpoIIE family protein phosphatase [Oscillospiraceae bacterium]|nr:SpoIIE family protein phosphatase [Oscillospiraceae bacterium]MDD4367630.1 SpoIIE family protein phosphatase [Oscillospiraceae bacterium]